MIPAPAPGQLPAMVEIPSLVGKSLDAAKQALEDRQLTPGNIASETDSDKSKDTVLDQFPAAGQKAQLGTKVDLKVAAGKAAAEKSSLPQTTVTQSSASGQQAKNGSFPNFAGSWELIELTFQGQPQSFAKGLRFAITQDGGLVHFRNADQMFPSLSRVKEPAARKTYQWKVCDLVSPVSPNPTLRNI